MITRTISHYNILEVLGEGGMGIVYKARDLNLDRLVALKFLPHALTSDQNLTAQFIREARSASQLDHPNICTIHDFEKTDDDQYYIVMAYCQGQTLEQYLSEKGPLPLKEFLDMAIQIGAGMATAHQAGLIHRDLKPANIMVDKDGLVKILDFGLAGMRNEINRSGSPAGTLPYMSPEQLIGNPIDQRTDIWSFGVIMYQMLCGRLPFNGDDDPSLNYAIMKKMPPDLESIKQSFSNPVATIIRKSLEKPADQRYQSMDLLIRELQKINRQKFPPTADQKTGRLNSTRLLAVISLTIVLSLLALFIFSPFSSSPETPIRIAVLPFADLGPDSTETYFSEGISEEIRSQLARIRGFRIIARESIEYFNRLDLNKAEITEKLEVDFILDGSIIRDNGRIRLIAQLSDPENEEIQWTASYDRALTDILNIQVDIAREIASTLKVKYTLPENERFKQPAQLNPSAYNFYLKGYQYYMRENTNDNEISIELFKKAIQIDPEYAPAYAGLSWAYTSCALPFKSDYFYYDSALVMANKALDLDKNCPEAYLALGMLKARFGSYKQASYQEACEAYSKALEIAPNDYRTLYLIADMNRRLGKIEESIIYFEQAIKINPMGDFAYAGIGLAYLAGGDLSMAETYLNKSLEIAPDSPYAIRGLADLYFRHEQYGKTIKILKKGIHFSPEYHWYHHDLGITYKNLNRQTEAITSFEHALEIMPNEKWHYLGIASVYEENNKYDEAIIWYEQTLSKFPHSHFVRLLYSFLLSKLDKQIKARLVLEEILKDAPDGDDELSEFLIPICEFYLGTKSEVYINNYLKTLPFEILQNKKYICYYYYFAMAHLLNLGTNGTTMRDTTKAITFLQKYITEAEKDDVEFSLARAQLRKLKGLAE